MRKDKDGLQGKPRYRMLYTVTALTLSVFLVFALASFLLLNRSMNHLTKRSQEILRETQAQTIKSSTEYIYLLTGQRAVENLATVSPLEIYQAFINREILPFQEEMCREIRAMVERGLNGLDSISVVLLVEPGEGRPPQNVVYLSHDESLVYKATVPGKIVEAIKSGEEYLWMEGGIPEFGLPGEHLVILQPFNPGIPGTTVSIVCTRPMHEEISRIESLLEGERRNNLFFLLTFMAAAMGVLVLVVLILLRQLIISRITRPIERLAGAAARVMEGDLDVEIDVDEKGEFAVLEKAFKNMVESLRRVIEKSLGGQ
jgi:nitrogen fixation/metabolism regulation signal transduction histidine kinase